MKALFGNELLLKFQELMSSAKSRIWICVPYVGSLHFVDRISNGIFLRPPVDFRFITDINELSNLNLPVFKKVLELGELRTLRGVHAKIYIIDSLCLVTSANLTETAFTKRHEVGILLTSRETDDILEIFRSFWKKSDKVTELSVVQTSKKITSTDEKFGFSLPQLWNIKTASSKHRYWLKPIGVSENPVTEDREFSNAIDQLHYAVNPKAVEIGDILIAYGIGAKRILAVYESTSTGSKLTDEEIDEEWMNRWPFYMNATNLTPNFGARWMEHNLYASELIQEYLEINPDGFVTFNKNKGLGALSWKKDKIRLDPHFAEFVLNKIDLLN